METGSHVHPLQARTPSPCMSRVDRGLPRGWRKGDYTQVSQGAHCLDGPPRPISSLYERRHTPSRGREPPGRTLGFEGKDTSQAAVHILGLPGGAFAGPGSWSELGAAPELAQLGGTQRGLQAQVPKPLAFGRSGWSQRIAGLPPRSTAQPLPSRESTLPGNLII